MVVFLVASAVVLGVPGCGGKKSAASRAPIEILDDALVPATLAAGLAKAGGGHVHATVTFHVDTAAASPAEGKPASPPTVTTTTDLWLDKKGNYRLAELNDQDGGREIVRVGAELAVALRYGKMIRRAALDAESKRYLSEALGGPWAAWELTRRQVQVDGNPGTYRLRLGAHKVALPAGFSAPDGLRKWRDSVVVKSLDGQASLAPTGSVLGFACQAGYQAERDGGAVEGSIVVTFSVDQPGSVPDVVLPPSEPLHTRQRTILEEKALLGAIGATGKKSSP